MLSPAPPATCGGILQTSIRMARSKSGQPDIKRITLDEHPRILRPIESRDLESSALAMMAHLQGARERMRPG